MKRVVMPIHGRDYAEHQHRHENRKFQHRRHDAHQPNAADIYVCQQRDQRHRNQIMFPAHQRWEKSAQIIAEQHRVTAPEQPRSAPVPPARQESPEISEARAHPAVESAFDGNCGRQFRGNEGNRNAPEERNQQEIEQRQARPAGRHHLFHAERAAGRVGKHHEHEIEEPRFSYC
jgi:hypothetical protein